MTTTGPWDEIGAYQGATGAVTVTGAGSTWASGGAIQIGVGGNGSLTISNGASVTAVDDFEVGQQGNSSTNDGSSGTLLIESGGTAVTGGHANGGSYYDTVGLDAAGPTSTVIVTGTGSSWTMNANLNINMTGAVYAADGGTIAIADDIDMVAGSLLSVDSTSAITDDGSAAEAGYLTLGPDSQGQATLSGDGTVDANIIDNGIVFATQGTLTLNGSISGSYKLKLGNQATLALNGGPVSNALGVYFLGWYGDLEIGDASGFSDSINDFVAGDMIDLTNVKFTSSNYTYTPPSYRNGPADLQIVENGVTYNLNVDNDEASFPGGADSDGGRERRGNGNRVRLDARLAVQSLGDRAPQSLQHGVRPGERRGLGGLERDQQQRPDLGRHRDACRLLCSGRGGRLHDRADDPGFSRRPATAGHRGDRREHC